MSISAPATHIGQASAQKIAAEVVQHFALINAVRAIYYEITSKNLHFHIFTDEQHYDDTLMDALIAAELAAVNNHGDVRILFDFTPLILVSKIENAVSANAQQIFMR